MTLPELLVAITIMGLLVTVMSSAIVVTMRQTASTEGRINVARAEQSISMWMPADLASADDVNVAPDASACPGQSTYDGPCPGLDLGPGSSALLITWSTLESDPPEGTATYNHTYVSYYYSQNTDTAFQLTRIECTTTAGENPSGGWTCNAVRVLNNLPLPPGGWAPGDPVPEDVIAVTIPLDAGATDESDTIDPTQNSKNASRVIVTVNGGGSGAGAGGGQNTISITAGGTNRTEIDAVSMQGAPTFVEARSKCGGPVTLVIDESNSIPNIGTVRTSVREFVKTLVGTPVRLQVVTFSDFSRTLGTNEWTRYFDLTNSADVNALIGNPPHNSGGVVDQISLAGNGATGRSGDSRTNWEDALFRSFRTTDGLVPQTIPKTWIFFTDGIPSRSRISQTEDGRSYRSDTQSPVTPVTGPEWGSPFIPNNPSDVYYGFNQVGFNRANYWANQARGSVQKMVGVFVGAALNDSSNWISSPGAGYHLTWERGSYTYQVATTWGSYRVRWMTRPGSSGSNWSPVTHQTWLDAPSNRRRPDPDPGGSNTNSWYTVTSSAHISTFNSLNTVLGSSDGFHRSNPGGWTPTSTAAYQAAQGTVNSDAYRANPSGKQFSNGPDWEPWSGAVPSNPDNTYRSVKVYGGSAPFDGFDAPVSGGPKPNIDILGELIAPGGYVQAQWNNATNSWQDLDADIYATTDWNRLAPALKAIALGECGGTLTLQTRQGSTSVPDPFVYQNSKQFDASGNQLDITPTTVTTNLQFTTGTFDFDITSGLYRVAEIVPHNLSSLGAYSPGGWTCNAGVRAMVQGSLSNPANEYEVFPIAGSSWTGIRVRVGANQAVSCTQQVTTG